jgi:hypothetical protein
MNATELVDRMKAGYATCSSYTDRGYAESESNRIDFQTFYIGKDRFRFNCLQGATNELDVFYTNQSGVYTYRSTKGTTALGGLDRAIGAGSAISFGAINAVTELLFPGLMRPTTFGGHHKTVSDGIVDGVPVYVVKSNNYISTLDIWISKPDLVVRKIMRQINRASCEEAGNKLSCQIVFEEVCFGCPVKEEVFHSIP